MVVEIEVIQRTPLQRVYLYMLALLDIRVPLYVSYARKRAPRHSVENASSIMIIVFRLTLIKHDTL